MFMSRPRARGLSEPNIVCYEWVETDTGEVDRVGRMQPHQRFGPALAVVASTVEQAQVLNVEIESVSSLRPGRRVWVTISYDTTQIARLLPADVPPQSEGRPSAETASSSQVPEPKSGPSQPAKKLCWSSRAKGASEGSTTESSRKDTPCFSSKILSCKLCSSGGRPQAVRQEANCLQDAPARNSLLCLQQRIWLSAAEKSTVLGQMPFRVHAQAH